MELPLDVLCRLFSGFTVSQKMDFFLVCKRHYSLYETHCKALPLPDLRALRVYTVATSNIASLPCCDVEVGAGGRGWRLHVLVRKVKEGGRGEDLLILMKTSKQRLQFNRDSWSEAKVHIGLVGMNEYGGKLQWIKKENCDEPEVYQLPKKMLYDRSGTYCWNESAEMHLFGGGVVEVKDLKAGDVLLASNGTATIVKKVHKTEINGFHHMAKVGDFYLTRGHPVYVNSDWYRADEMFPVGPTWIQTLYNFYAEPESFVVVGKERIVCSCLGGYCPRVVQLNIYSDVLYGRGYGSYESEDFSWLAQVKHEIPSSQLIPRPPPQYLNLYPGREHLKILPQQTPS